MRINSKHVLIFFITISMLSFFSCQTKKIVSYENYKNLDSLRKKEVDGNLNDVLKHLGKKENEIVLLFQYNCFLGEKIEINNGSKLDFPKVLNESHYGQKFSHFRKDIGNIKIELSNGKEFFIQQKKGFDYIGICYYEKEDKLYIEYFDYPRILITE